MLAGAAPGAAVPRPPLLYNEEGEYVGVLLDMVHTTFGAPADNIQGRTVLRRFGGEWWTSGSHEVFFTQQGCQGDAYVLASHHQLDPAGALRQVFFYDPGRSEAVAPWYWYRGGEERQGRVESVYGGGVCQDVDWAQDLSLLPVEEVPGFPPMPSLDHIVHEIRMEPLPD